MNSTTLGLLISGLVSILTVFGVQAVQSYTKGREATAAFRGKEYDDGIERRKELIKEIDGYKKTIEEKDKAMESLNNRILSLKDEISALTIKYVRLEGRYNEAVGDLETFSRELAQKFKNASQENS